MTTKTETAERLDEVRLIAQIDDAYALIRGYPQKTRVAVYVVDEGCKWCTAGGTRQRRYDLEFGHGHVGVYNRNVTFDQLVADVFWQAEQGGLL